MESEELAQNHDIVNVLNSAGQDYFKVGQDAKIEGLALAEKGLNGLDTERHAQRQENEKVTFRCQEKPRGKPKSGRVWKDFNKKRFSQMVKDRPLHTSWEVKMRDRQEKKLLKSYSQQLKQEKQHELYERKRRREENLKRRLQNERKAEVVQVIRNPGKLKRAGKKQLRRIEKRDTLMLSSQPK
ncbi:coiled-coil domain-containing protein 86 [Rhinophrynus dorsalis]